MKEVSNNELLEITQELFKRIKRKVGGTKK